MDLSKIFAQAGYWSEWSFACRPALAFLRVFKVLIYFRYQNFLSEIPAGNLAELTQETLRVFLSFINNIGSNCRLFAPEYLFKFKLFMTDDWITIESKPSAFIWLKIHLWAINGVHRACAEWWCASSVPCHLLKFKCLIKQFQIKTHFSWKII